MSSQWWRLALAAALVTATQAAGDCSAAPLARTSMHGGDLKPVIKRYSANASACCAMCAAHPDCSVWTWVQSASPASYDHVCWFKDSTAGRVGLDNHTSGITTPPRPPAPHPKPKPGPTPCTQGSGWCPPPYPPLPPPDRPPARVCKTCKAPVFSWYTLPAFFHGCSTGGPGGGFDAADLDVIKHFKLVTLEKWQGSTVTPYMWEEDAWVVAAKQIKAVNPDVSVVVWLDSFRIYTANKSLNPDLGPGCTTGHYRAGVYPELHPDMLLKNTSGKPALEPWSKCHIYDFEKEYVRRYWTDVCLNMTDSGVIDGCGADASWQVDPTGGTTDPATMTGWDIGHRTMMRDTTLALGNGVLLGKDPWELGYHVNGVLHESCHADNTTINTLRNLSAAAAATPRAGANFSGPLIYECHGQGKLNEVAAFLIGAGPNHYYGFGGWTSVNGHYDESLMGQKLGVPDGEGQYDAGSTTWTRTFAGGHGNGGSTATFNVSSNTGVIMWAGKLS